MTRGFLIACAALTVVLAAGCTAKTPSEAQYAPIRFDKSAKFRFDVSGIDVRSIYKSPALPPNVEHLFPIRPAAAAMQWGRDRLRAAGRGGAVRLVVRRASVVEEKLKRTKGLRGLVTRDQSERYKGVVEVSLDVVDDRGKVLGHASTVVHRTRTVTEDVSMAGRERVWYEMTQAMMTDLDKALSTQIRRHLGQFLKN